MLPWRQVLAPALLNTVVVALQWTDTVHCRRMVAVADHVLVWSAAHNNAYAADLGHALLQAALKVRPSRVPSRGATRDRARARARADTGSGAPSGGMHANCPQALTESSLSDCHDNLLQLIAHTYIQPRAVSEAPKHVFLQLPNATVASINVRTRAVELEA